MERFCNMQMRQCMQGTLGTAAGTVKSGKHVKDALRGISELRGIDAIKQYCRSCNQSRGNKYDGNSFQSQNRHAA